jgi:putative DNA-invertase from lambdoid prophage Rac
VTAFGYVRQSRADDDAPSQSPKVQEERIRALASARGESDLVIVEPDLNVSGGKSMADRPGFARIVEAIKTGECTAVYAYDLSRLFRNLKEQIEFFEITEARGIPVRLVDGMVTEIAGPTGELMLSVLGAMNQWQRKEASAKIKASLARRERETGMRNGNKPYGSRPGEEPSVVVEAFDEAQSFDGAARLLNERGFPARGKKTTETSVWYGSSVRDVVKRERPDLFAGKTPRGMRSGVGPYNLSRLLICGQCRSMMSPSVDARNGDVRYTCNKSRIIPHGRGMVSEHVLMPAIVDECDRARLVMRKSTMGSVDDEAKAAKLGAKRERIIDLAADGLIDKAEVRRRLDEVDEAMRRLHVRRNVLRIKLPPVIVPDVLDDGTVIEADPPKRVNAYLRSLFSSITVESMKDRALRGPHREPIEMTFTWVDESLKLGAA